MSSSLSPQLVSLALHRGSGQRFFSGSEQTLPPFKTSSKLELSMGLVAKVGWEGSKSPR